MVGVNCGFFFQFVFSLPTANAPTVGFFSKKNNELANNNKKKN